MQRALNYAHSVRIFGVEKVFPLTLETAGQQLGWDAINQSQRQEDDWYKCQNIGDCAKQKDSIFMTVLERPCSEWDHDSGDDRVEGASCGHRHWKWEREIRAACPCIATRR
jgi:hypothetical protein